MSRSELISEKRKRAIEMNSTSVYIEGTKLYGIDNKKDKMSYCDSETGKSNRNRKASIF